MLRRFHHVLQVPAWSPEVLAKCPPTGRAALSGDASYPPKAEVPQPSVNGTPVVAEAKKQINGQENTASRQKAEGVAMDKSTQTENDATVRELRLRVEALEEIVLKLTAERTSSSSSSRPAMPSSRATASSQKAVEDRLQ